MHLEPQTVNPIYSNPNFKKLNYRTVSQTNFFYRKVGRETISLISFLYDRMIYMKEIKKELIKFQEERDWKKFHTPENLAKSISIEAAELLEHFQWQKDYDIDEVAEELADVLIYSVYMAEALNLDVKEIILNKMEKNAIKYPVKKSKGVATKYDRLWSN